MTAAAPLLVRSFDAVDSTNTVARRLLGEPGAPAVFAVLAAEQTAGRGQHDRRWCSPRGAGAFLSLALRRPPIPVARLPWCAPAVGVACAAALRELAALDVRLKPPNDLYLAGRKLGGILKEAEIAADGGVAWLVTGIGINTRRAARPLPAGAPAAVCLEEVLSPDLLRMIAGPDLRSAPPDAAVRELAIDDPALPPLVTVVLLRVVDWLERIAAGKLADIRAAYSSSLLPGAVLPADLPDR